MVRSPLSISVSSLFPFFSLMLINNGVETSVMSFDRDPLFASLRKAFVNLRTRLT